MNCNIDFLTQLYEYFSLVRAPNLSKYSSNQMLWKKTNKFDHYILSSLRWLEVHRTQQQQQLEIIYWSMQNRKMMDYNLF